MFANGVSKRRIKWSYATHVLSDLPATGMDLDGRLGRLADPPNANDVIVAEVLEIGRHKKIELPCKRPSTLFPGDLVGMAYGYRYATRQFEGTVPAGHEPCHMLTVGGVCGEVVGMPTDMDPPTTLRSLGYLLDSSGRRVNLETHGIKLNGAPFAGATTILVVGSSMDSGKTTAAYSVVHGLTRAGARVCAAKVTGTASAKDPIIMEDAGALKILDFTDLGHASTAMCSREQLWNIVTVTRSQLAALRPDYIVLEVADGIVQRETSMLLELFQVHRNIDYVIYTCNDSLGVASGVNRLRQYELNVAAVSGWVGCSPLAAHEAQAQTDVPVLRPEDLREPDIIRLFTKSNSERRAAEGDGVILTFPTPLSQPDLATGST
jgi:hypothetical protein